VPRQWSVRRGTVIGSGVGGDWDWGGSARRLSLAIGLSPRISGEGRLDCKEVVMRHHGLCLRHADQLVLRWRRRKLHLVAQTG